MKSATGVDRQSLSNDKGEENEGFTRQVPALRRYLKGRTMHVHNVYFWLNSKLDSQTLTEFEQGLASLIGDPSVRAGYYGKPAATHRDVVENSYTYGLVLVFDDLVGHDAYQTGAAHLKFLEDQASKWVSLIVHDIQTD